MIVYIVCGFSNTIYTMRINYRKRRWLKLKIFRRLREIIVYPVILMRTAGVRKKLKRAAEAEKRDILDAPESAEFLKKVRQFYGEQNSGKRP